MTVRQRLLKIFYPVFMGLTRLLGKKNKYMKNTAKAKPVQSFYDLPIQLNNGSNLDMATLKGKKLLLVNTASNCGYTSQYNDLQRLYEAEGSQLVVIGFPANDFKEQEPGGDAEIAEFCKVNFGVTFPLAAKTSVVSGPQQHPVFQWLSDPARNGWCNQEPVWNFSKYLVNEEGVLTDYFDPAVSPVSDVVKEALK